MVASAFTAQVTGKVTAVDRQSGKLTLRGPDGELSVRFPPPAVQNVKQGDLVTVAVGLMEQNPSASPGSTTGATSSKGTGTTSGKGATSGKDAGTGTKSPSSSTR